MTAIRQNGWSFDAFLVGQGTCEEILAFASERVLAWRSAGAVRAEHLDAAEGGRAQGKTASEVERLLALAGATVELVMLRRAVDAVGRGVRLELT